MSEFLDAAIEIAGEAGQILLAHRGVSFELKGDYDLVTAADRASEQLIVKRLRERFPQHGIVAEEGGRAEMQAEKRWYVDPLDGTTNFAHGFPMWNVTLALADKDEVIAGVVFDPLNRELFAAERGGGARLNGAPIHVSKASSLGDSLLSTGFPSRKRHQNVNIHFYYQIAMMSHGVRRGGSAAIDLAYTACGRLEAFWEFGLNPWDMAAGSLLVEEAGGTVSGMQGEGYDVNGRYVVADNGLVHGELLDLFADIFAGNYQHEMPGLPAPEWELHRG
ncbi:MAG TPA: inositol monophosphatase family protein [Bryobacteraceae bacterium]|jgi:myo-inositol-1(or 4)-monophosphatase|nr:inositol monophosphatase family protein [Bryobacteraceae bacterium]